LFSVKDPNLQFRLLTEKNAGLEFCTANLRHWQSRKFNPIEQACMAIPAPALQWTSVLFCTQMNGGDFYGKNRSTSILLSSCTLSDWHKVPRATVYHWCVHEFLLFTPFFSSQTSQVLFTQRMYARKGSGIVYCENQVWLKSSSVSDMLSR